MAQHLAGGSLGILHAHPASDGVGHVVGQRHNICSLACILQYVCKPLQLFIIESIVVLTKSFRSFTVQENDADMLFGYIIVAVCLAFYEMQVVLGLTFAGFLECVREELTVEVSSGSAIPIVVARSVNPYTREKSHLFARLHDHLVCRS